MGLVNKIKKLASNIDSVNIDVNLLKELDSDKLLKIFNILQQLSTLVEAKSEFNKYIKIKLHEELENEI